MKQFRFYITISLCFIVFIGLCTLSGCQRNLEPISKSDFYLNTIITITIYDKQQESVLDDCFTLAQNYENLLSTKLECSDIYKINHSNGDFVTVDDETLYLLQKGLEYAAISDGNFDITIGSLSTLWNFSENPGNVPNDADIKKAATAVDYHNIVIDGNNVKLTNPESQIDLGGIAKGYIADRMKDLLLEKGLHSGIIDLGGNILVVGPKENGDTYHIGIQKPFSANGTAIAMVEINDQSVVSSGVYQRRFYKDGSLYHHLLNPKTGYPFDNNLLGVSIVCDNSVDGDGLSTSCFALGLEKGLELIESLPDTEAIFITSDYQIYKSSGIGTTIPFQEFDN